MNDQQRGRRQAPRTQRRRFLSGPFVFFVLFSFLLFVMVSQFQSFVFGEKKLILTNRLSAVASYVRVVNRPTAELVRHINTLMHSYNTDILTNVFDTHQDIIRDIFTLVTNTDDKILLKDNEKLQKLFQFVEDIEPYQEELQMYLGANESKSYLVILQNNSESRPNGGFFGSFAFVRLVHGRIRAFHIIDSYLGYKTMPRVTVKPPVWSAPIYHNEPFGRIAANKFGFTNIDGEYLIQLYNKTFNTPESYEFIPPEVCSDMCGRPIEGVVFVQSDVLKMLMPGLDKKTRERQFLNASIDLLRGDNLPNKKEYYLRDSQEFFKQNQTAVFTNFIKEFDRLTSRYHIGVYIPTISSGLGDLLTNYHFTTIPNNKTIYSRDTNKAFNKVDEFITKDIVIRNTIGDIVHEQRNHNHIPIHMLDEGLYTLEISYTLHIPDQYIATIHRLADEHEIVLTDRERGILSLGPTYDQYGNPRLWSTRSQLYYPSFVTLRNLSGNLIDTTLFTTPFGQGIEYALETDQNKTTHRVVMELEIKN